VQPNGAADAMADGAICQSGRR